MSHETSDGTPALRRALGAWDGASITVGAVLGTAIFLTPSDIARALPHAGLILAVWIAGGLLTLAGALTYSEMGALFPRAGGMYHFLKEAYGPLAGFLFGWASFLVIMSGGIAALGAGFGEYLGGFLPFFSTKHVLFALPVGGWTWSVNGGQLAGLLGIAFLTAVNLPGVEEGAWVQNLVTIAKVGALALLAAVGLFVRAPARPDFGAALPHGFLSACGVAMIAVLWAYDGWYCFALSAGEVHDPGRNVPRGLILGTGALVVIYGVTNLVYLRALPISEMAGAERVGEAAVRALFGPATARLASAAILVSIFGCLAANILTCSRIYQPMAEDGLFFRVLTRIHPKTRVPAASLIAQGVWASVLVLSGSFEQLYTYVIFIEVLFFVLTGLALYVLRRKFPDAPRPYRTWGYPWVPALFVAASFVLMVNTLREKPVEALWGLGLLVLGLPAYALWRRRSRARGRVDSFRSDR
ncbi:MAG TPA: amino acid permease [Thermoanaerobaculia bacterium]|nr:amino acid permease [Thermoanaerobaculia bacterium]